MTHCFPTDKRQISVEELDLGKDHRPWRLHRTDSEDESAGSERSRGLSWLDAVYRRPQPKAPPWSGEILPTELFPPFHRGIDLCVGLTDIMEQLLKALPQSVHG